MATASYSNILTETRGKVAIITLNRPKALNALNGALIVELVDALEKFDKDPGCSAIVLTGSTKAFAAGADIKEMASKTFIECFKSRFIENWGGVSATRKPIIAAVNGFALGGGCELAMMCDIIYAGDNASFAQPEIKLGVIPGGGGTQRLVRAVGKSKAMELILTGDTMTAQEALAHGLVAKVFPADQTLDQAIAVATRIAAMSQPATIMAKEAVNQAFELSLQQGLRNEVRTFWTLFGTKDQKEGMAAFAEKRKPNFTDE